MTDQQGTGESNSFLRRNRRGIVVVISLAVVLLAGFVVMTRRTESKILADAIYLQRKTGNTPWQQVMRIVWERDNVLNCNPATTFCPESLSYFFLTFRFGMSHEYEFSFPDSKDMCSTARSRLGKCETLVLLNELTEQHWNWKGDRFSGSFSFKTPFGVQGRCLFDGKNGKIERMVIARKGSDKLEEGYAVFGARYGHNPLSENNQDEAVCLPLGEGGEYITYERYDELSPVHLSMRKDGTINIAMHFLTANQLDEMLNQVLTMPANKRPPIFLWLDKRCPPDATKALKQKLQSKGFIVYQLFVRPNDGCIVANKLNNAQSLFKEEKEVGPK